MNCQQSVIIVGLWQPEVARH